MDRSSRYRIVFGITVAVLVLDQLTKWIAKEHLQYGVIFSYLGDLFRLQYAENTGAFLSLGSTLPDPWRQLIFTGLVGVFLAALLVYLLFSQSLTPFAVICLALVCAGGISNLIDRIAYDGRVVDFLNVGIGPLRTGIFNIADMAITGGALLMLVDSFRSSKAAPSTDAGG